MRSIEAITKDLNDTVSEVQRRRTALTDAEIKADSLIKEANKLTGDATAALEAAKNNAGILKQEYQELMNELVPDLNTGRVRQS